MADSPSHTDVSVLYLPLMPETSKLGEAMVQAGKDATESFGKGSSGIGDKIHESFSKSKDKIKDVFHRSGSDAAEAMAEGVKEKSSTVEDAVAGAGEKAKGKFRESAKDWGKVLVDAVGPDTKKLLGDRLEETVGGALEGVLGDNAKWAGKFSHTVADWGFDELKNKLGGATDAAKTTKAAFADLTGGNTTGGVSKLVDSFGKLDKVAKDFGVDVGGLPQPLQDVINKTTGAKKSAEEFAGVFKDLPGKIGLVGTAIEALGPIIAGAMGGLEVVKQVISGAQALADAHPHSLGDAGRNMGIPVGPLPGLNQPSVLPFMQPPASSGSTPAPGDIPGMMLPSAPTSGQAHNFYKDWYPAGGASAPTAASSVPLVQKPDGTWTSPNPAWAHLINRESGGRPSVENDYDSNAQAGDPSRGLFQFTRATWARSGGLKYGPDPGKATPQQQAEIAANLIKANPSGGDWGAGLPGRENASALLSGVGSGGGTTSAGWWNTRSSGGSPTSDPSSALASGGAGGSGSARGSITAPIGNQHDPIYTTSVSPDGSPSGGSGGDAASQQLGSGFLDGIMQSVGLDGSVFKTFGGASNPLDFGATKMGMGLLNWGMGLAQQKGGGKMPGMGSSLAAGLGESPTRGSGGYTPANQTNHIDNSFSVTQNGVQGTGVQPWAAAANSSTPYASQTSQPAFGN